MKKILFSLLGVVLVLGAAWFTLGSKAKEQTDIFVKAKRGQFFISVTSSGELQAKNSIEIQGPENVRNVGIWNMKIARIVPEGTSVKAGDFVADLDKSEIASKLKEAELSIQKFESQYTQAKLDTALSLAQSRDDLINLKYSLEEKKILKEQSVYEAPAIRRQAEIDFERAERTFTQAKESYKTKVEQAVAKMKSVEADLMKERQKVESLVGILQGFSIKAPSDGMVIYYREWNGRKRAVGSTIGAWDPVVATLPDLSVMESVTFINEVDIQKIKSGLDVRIKLDADPKKILTGKITQVANIGEQRPNSDSKVFEVRINVNESDTTLRPAMTTGNEIIISTLDNVLSVPIESVHSDGGKSFVYKKSGNSVVRRQVELGMMNENEVVIQKGLADNDEILLSLPSVELSTIPTEWLQ